MKKYSLKIWLSQFLCLAALCGCAVTETSNEMQEEKNPVDSFGTETLSDTEKEERFISFLEGMILEQIADMKEIADVEMTLTYQEEGSTADINLTFDEALQAEEKEEAAGQIEKYVEKILESYEFEVTVNFE